MTEKDMEKLKGYINNQTKLIKRLIKKEKDPLFIEYLKGQVRAFWEIDKVIATIEKGN